LLVILQASAHKRALIRAAVGEPALTPAAIYARLTEGRRASTTVDYAKAAAHDRDDEE